MSRKKGHKKHKKTVSRKQLNAIIKSASRTMGAAIKRAMRK